MVKMINQNEFDAEVMQAKGLVVVDMYADWCGPCKMMAPVVEQLAAEYDGKIKIGKLNVDEEPEIAQRYGVMSIPTFIYFKGGEVVEQSLGAVTADKLKEAITKVTG